MYDSRYSLIQIPIPGKLKTLIPILIPIEISDSDSDPAKIGLIPESIPMFGIRIGITA